MFCRTLSLNRREERLLIAAAGATMMSMLAQSDNPGFNPRARAGRDRQQALQITTGGISRRSREISVFLFPP
jgi:hypothetical protein